MMNILKALFHPDPENRDSMIAATSGLGITVNILIAAIKVVIGAMASSIAIMSEGVNNATDALTSVLALLGTKLAKKRPDEKHPFGYGRIEYLASLVIAVLILVTGVEMMISSVKLIFTPEALSISYLSLIIVAVSAVIKFFLSLYTIRVGKKTESYSLIGVGMEGRNDSFASLITIVAAVLFLLFDFSVDAYAGILISLLILKTGGEILAETVSDLLGRPGEKELAALLYREIRTTKGILGAADMMLHNYGPEAWSGSVNVEIDHSLSVGEVYQFLHQLQLRLMHEYKVTMVFGVYAVDNDHEQIRRVRKDIAGFLQEHVHIKNFHAVYIDEAAGDLYCDFVVDYQLKDWDGLRTEFTAYMAERYPQYRLELTVETEFV